jgi:hypothetical protein
MMEPNPAFGNPFGAPQPPQPANDPTAMHGANNNPFGGGVPPVPPQHDPWNVSAAVSAPTPQFAAQDSESVAGYSTNPTQAVAINQNPFGAPPVVPQQQPGAFGYPATQPTQQLPPPVTNSYAGPTNVNPYGAHSHANGTSSVVWQHDQSTYGSVPTQQPAQGYGNSIVGDQYEPQPQPQPQQQSNPFGAPPPQAHHALVVAPTQSNPYAMAPPPAYAYSQPQQQQQQLVAAPQQANPWSMPPQQQYPYEQNQHAGAMTTYDPFAMSAPPPPPAPTPDPVNHELDLFFQPAPPKPPVEPYQPPAPVTEYVSHDPPGIPANGQPRDPPPRSNDTQERDGRPEPSTQIKPPPDTIAPPKGTTYPPQLQYGHRPNDEPDREPVNKGSPRNPLAPMLAREAPPGASPLPKADLVRKRGFVLGRISFRTIVMKKWKQTYWVQYGPHTMLWFRSQADFDDWLNNPYHMQTERNFLIKLAVNFVHDLYKPNVRGYQVTQCRTKGYGNKIVRQFKLERWMDYGPTIAAAFGSYDPSEVDALREAVVECMRNTPLNGGIRATGAVRQQNPSLQDRDSYEDEEGTWIQINWPHHWIASHTPFHLSRLWRSEWSPFKLR